MARDGSLTTTTGNAASFGLEAFDQRSEIGKDAVVESHLQRDGEFGLAGALEREREVSWTMARVAWPRCRPASKASNARAKARRGKS